MLAWCRASVLVSGTYWEKADAMFGVALKTTEAVLAH